MRFKEQPTKLESELLDTIEGLRSDLDAALDLMVRVASGKQTVTAMGEWVSLNYPKYRRRLPKAMCSLPPKNDN